MLNLRVAILIGVALAVSLPFCLTQECSRECLNACDQTLSECLLLCKCDDFLKASEISIPDSQENLEETVFSMDAAKQSLLEVKEKWVNYRREYNAIKKYENKIKKVELLNLQYQATAEEGILDIESCDMSCAQQCIKPRSDFRAIANCLENTCSCTLKVNLAEVLAFEREDTLNQHAPEFVIESDLLMCNQTCTQDCDVVKTFLTEAHYLNCMKERCGCNQLQIVNIDTLFLVEQPQQQVEQTEYSDLTKIVLVLVLMTIFFSAIIAIALYLTPSRSQKPLKQAKNVIDTLETKVRTKLGSKGVKAK